jgi:hypothetical protein
MDVRTAFAHVGGNRALVMIGGHLVSPPGTSSWERGDCLIVRFRARARDRIKQFSVTLENDLYTVHYYRGQDRTLREVDYVSGVYAEDLRKVLETRTGLAFRL